MCAILCIELRLQCERMDERTGRDNEKESEERKRGIGRGMHNTPRSAAPVCSPRPRPTELA